MAAMLGSVSAAQVFTFFEKATPEQREAAKGKFKSHYLPLGAMLTAFASRIDSYVRKDSAEANVTLAYLLIRWNRFQFTKDIRGQAKDKLMRAVWTKAHEKESIKEKLTELATEKNRIAWRAEMERKAERHFNRLIESMGAIGMKAESIKKAVEKKFP
jgi:hypothetical protein